MAKHRRRSRKPRRALLALCTATVTVGSGVTLASSGYAEPEPTLEEVRDRVNDLYHEAEKAAERYNAATDEQSDLERRVQRAEAGVKRQKAEVDETLQGLARFVTASYQVGGVDPTLRTLLSDDPSSMLGEASALDAYTKQQASALQRAKKEQLELEQKELIAKEERRHLNAIEDKLKEEKDRVDAKAAEAEALLDDLEEEERQRIEDEREDHSDDSSRDDDRSGEDYPDVPSSGRGAVAVEFAMAQVGDAYVYSASGPDAWDCSGLTQAAWAEAGVSISRSSSTQVNDGTPVSLDAIVPGDLLFWSGHVAMYIGDGQMVHAANPSTSVIVSDIDYMGTPYAATRPG